MTPGGGLRALISSRPPGYQMGLLYRLATRQLSPEFMAEEYLQYNTLWYAVKDVYLKRQYITEQSLEHCLDLHKSLHINILLDAPEQ